MSLLLLIVKVNYLPDLPTLFAPSTRIL